MTHDSLAPLALQAMPRPRPNPGVFKQRGGTFLGLILGLVLGLGVALAVAVYVTKVPVPFVNKSQSRTGEQDAAETKKNKDWDPNAMIQGKNPIRPAAPASERDGSASPPKDATKEAKKDSAKEAAKESGKEPAKEAPLKDAAKDAAKEVGKDTAKTPGKEPAKEPVKEATKEATKEASKDSAKADAKPDAKSDTKPAASADPLGDLVKARSAGASAEPFTYMVQTGAFRNPEEAEAQRAKLTITGMDVKVTEREQSGRTVYRVRVGPFERKEDAEKAKDKLEGSGFETVLVRIQR
jgi:cell division protein FtsN